MAAKDNGGQYLIRSIWQQSNEETEKLLSIDIVECPSRAAAHEVLLQMLGEFQGAVVTRKEQSAFGDVTFTAPRESMVLFARANLAIMVRNAGRALVPVTGIADQIDAVLTTKDMAGAAIRIELKTEGYKVGQHIPMGVAPDRSQDRQWYKFFSSPGEILLEKRMLVYEYSSEEPPEITVLVVSPHRDATNQNMIFEWPLNRLST
jgi:hypothetical protein